jgi:invasion protein IalB
MQKEFIMINRSTLTTLRRVSAAAALAAMFVGAAAPASAKAAAGAVVEASATSTMPAATAPRVPSATTKYCMVDEITGSRLQKKVCKTKKEWKDLGVDIEAK